MDKAPAWEIRQGDALRLLEAMPDASVDAVITDPPYCSGGLTKGRKTSTRAKYVGSEGNGFADFTGDTRSQRGFLRWCERWLAECLRVTKPGGVLCAFIDWRNLTTLTDCIEFAGWTARGLVVWDKTAGVRPVRGRYTNQCEFVPWASNGEMPGLHEVYLPGVHTEQPRNRQHHQVEKPVDLMRWLCRIAPPGATILDPFAGSATTGVAALAGGQDFIGFEMTEHYAEVARKRLEGAHRLDTVAQQNLPLESERQMGLL